MVAMGGRERASARAARAWLLLSARRGYLRSRRPLIIDYMAGVSTAPLTPSDAVVATAAMEGAMVAAGAAVAAGSAVVAGAAVAAAYSSIPSSTRRMMIARLPTTALLGIPLLARFSRGVAAVRRGGGGGMKRSAAASDSGTPSPRQQRRLLGKPPLPPLASWSSLARGAREVSAASAAAAVHLQVLAAHRTLPAAVAVAGGYGRRGHHCHHRRRGRAPPLLVSSRLCPRTCACLLGCCCRMRPRDVMRVRAAMAHALSSAASFLSPHLLPSIQWSSPVRCVRC